MLRGAAHLSLPGFAAGSVWLVGAGPGDPGLLTLLGRHAIENADVIVHDALIGPGILALAGDRPRLVDVGKRGGQPSLPQAEITRRLIVEAQDGRKVVRLKGGDPWVFGRGGEEALELAAAGIPFRIVPGVSSGIGGLAYAGLPVTHRLLSEAVVLVTGHGPAGGLPTSLDWSALARMPVLVWYMPLRNIGGIVARLLEAGRSPDDPAAIVANATLPGQQVVETTLRFAARAAETVEAPALLVCGPVVELRRVLAWDVASGRE